MFDLDAFAPEILAQIENAPTHVPGVLGVHAVRARWLGHRVYSEVAIKVLESPDSGREIYATTGKLLPGWMNSKKRC